MAVRFLNSSSQYYVSSEFTSAACTIMAWVYVVSDLNTFVAFLTRARSSTNSVQAYCGTDSSGTTLLLSVGGNSNTGTSLSTGTWYHLCMTLAAPGSSGSHYIYLNGVQDVTVTATYESNSHNIAIATTAATTIRDFANMRAAHIKIWDGHQMTAAEVQKEMRTIRPQRTSNLIAWVPTVRQGAGSRNLNLAHNAFAFTENGTPTDEAGPPVSWGASSNVLPFVDAGGGGFQAAWALGSNVLLNVGRAA